MLGWLGALEREMGQTYQEWAEGHRRRGREEQGRALVVRQASRKFGAETGQRLEELVGSMGPEQLVRVGDAVVDCNTGDDLLAEAANGLPQGPDRLPSPHTTEMTTP